jgi:hypothetical protein
MENEVERFLNAEQTAEKLVETLKQLQKEAQNYDTAAKDLESVRQQLLTLIDTTKEICEISYNTIKTLREVNGPEIIAKLGHVEGIVTQNDISLQKQNEKDLLETFSRLEYLKGVVNSSGEMVTSIKEKELPQSFIVLNRLKMLIIIGIAASGIAIILGIISLVR